MDGVLDYSPHTFPTGTQQTNLPLTPTFYGAAGVGPNLVTDYKKALYWGQWDANPLNWLKRFEKAWHYYGIFTPEQMSREWNNPSRLLTFAIKAAGTESEDYMARYIGLVGGDDPEDWRTNLTRVITRSLPINRFSSALWDPRFDAHVGGALIPSVEDPRFEEKLTGDYNGMSRPNAQTRSDFTRRHLQG